MISLQAQIDRPSTRKLRKMQREAPNAYRRAVVLALRNARSQIRAAIKSGGGRNGVPSFVSKADATIALHGRGKWFGKLNSASTIKAWREGGVQHIGFITAVANFAGALQEKSYHELTQRQRRMFRAGGVANVPEYYDRPERLVIDPYRDYLEGSGRLAEWIAGIAENILSGKIGARRSGGSKGMARARAKGYAQARGRE